MSRFSKVGKRVRVVVLGVLAAGLIGGVAAAPAQAMPNDGHVTIWEWCFDWEGGFYGQCGHDL